MECRRRRRRPVLPAARLSTEGKALATIVGICYFLRINADALASCILILVRIVDEKNPSPFSQKMSTPFLGRNVILTYPAAPFLSGPMHRSSPAPKSHPCRRSLRTRRLRLAAFLYCMCEIFGFFRFRFYFVNFNPGWIKTRYRVELPSFYFPINVCSLLP